MTILPWQGDLFHLYAHFILCDFFDFINMVKCHLEMYMLYSCARYGLLIQQDAEAGKRAECSDTGFIGSCIFLKDQVLQEMFAKIKVVCYMLGSNGFPRQLELWFYMAFNTVLSHCHWV
ncbi:hypothetical protein HA466_0279080 [Hirschfeldia incana]|nr:hypothetical protein HA466_0279080 [Hirschfeldia incana]